MNEFQPLKIEDILAAIDGKPVKANYNALINQLDEKGQLAAMELIVNKNVGDTAKIIFLSPGITVEQVMDEINKRTKNNS